MLDANVEKFARAGQEIVGECRTSRLAIIAVMPFLKERRSDPLSDTAANLTIDDQRIEQHAAIFNNDIIEDFDLAVFRVYGDDGGVGRIAEGPAVPLRLVASRHFEAV